MTFDAFEHEDKLKRNSDAKEAEEAVKAENRRRRRKKEGFLFHQPLTASCRTSAVSAD